MRTSSVDIFIYIYIPPTMLSNGPGLKINTYYRIVVGHEVTNTEGKKTYITEFNVKKSNNNFFILYIYTSLSSLYYNVEVR
jgi:hypothetical protein